MAVEKILAVNIGSASKKYSVFEGEDEIAKFHFETEDDGFVVNIEFEGFKEEMRISEDEYDAALNYLLKFLKDKKLINTEKEIIKIGVRIVAPGRYFKENKLINKDYLKNLEKVKIRAPLHIEPTLKEIKKLKKIFKNIKIFGISDSAFHKDLSELAKNYALSNDIAAKYGIYRYGYHGISAQSVLIKIKELLGCLPEKIIICHLGSGSSIHAIKNGRSFDTSMGFTPLEGLPMATRIGNIDAGAVIYLAKKTGVEKLDSYFNTKCGLLGISDRTGDIRELLELERQGDSAAKLALELFIYNIKKFIGAYAAAMNGLDLLVFTATIGERSFIIRSRICQNLDFLGIKLDRVKNNNCISKDAIISAKNSKVKIMVIRTNEMAIIFKEVAKIS